MLRGGCGGVLPLDQRGTFLALRRRRSCRGLRGTVYDGLCLSRRRVLSFGSDRRIIVGSVVLAPPHAILRLLLGVPQRFPLANLSLMARRRCMVHRGQQKTV